MRLLTGGDVSAILRSLSSNQAHQLLDSFSRGLASYIEEQSKDHAKIIQPLRTVFQNYDGNTVLTMPVSDGDTVVKVATVPLKGDIAGAITVYGSAGELQGVLNAAEITAFRTALATMTILTRWPAPKVPAMCVFGSGKQAEWHIRLALLLVPGVTRLTVFNRGEERLQALDQNVLSELRSSHPDVTFRAVAKEKNDNYEQNLKETLADADIICCCTPSLEPLFGVEALREPAKPRFLSLIGSYKPNMHEIDTETVRLARDSGKVWVDLKDACLEEAGELIEAGLTPDDLSEIGELFATEKSNEKATLDAQRELTLFKCVGFGFMDLIISKALLHMAAEMDKGRVLEDF